MVQSLSLRWSISVSAKRSAATTRDAIRLALLRSWPQRCSLGNTSVEKPLIYGHVASRCTFLYGSPPFVGSSMSDTYDKIQNAELLLPPLPPHGEGGADHLLSESLTDLLTMLNKNPSERFSLDELMSQAWVCGFNSDVEAQATNPASAVTQTESCMRERSGGQAQRSA